jgi:hypothetical protein
MAEPVQIARDDVADPLPRMVGGLHAHHQHVGLGAQPASPPRVEADSAFDCGPFGAKTGLVTMVTLCSWKTVVRVPVSGCC